MPGLNGTPGAKGQPGQRGANGLNGLKGQKGESGGLGRAGAGNYAMDVVSRIYRSIKLVNQSLSEGSMEGVNWSVLELPSIE